MIKKIFLLIFLCFLIKKIFTQNLENDFFIIKKIEIFGNKKTKKIVILNELSFKENDTIFIYKKFINKISESHKNLKNLSLFNFVKIENENENENIFIKIKVEERWYLWGNVDLKYVDRNFNSWLEKKDYNRINYGLGISKYNFRGQNELLKFKFLLGFTEEFILDYRGFFFDKKRKNGISIKFSFLRTNSYKYQTFENKTKFYKSEDEYILKSIYPQIDYFYRKDFYQKHNFSIFYENVNISDTLKKLNENFLGESKNSIKTFSFFYKFEIDKRDNKNYALNGYFFEVNSKSIFFLNSNLNFIFSEIKYNFYKKIKKKIFLSFAYKFKKSLKKKIPFYLQKTLGYGDYLRGFEYYVIDGEDFFLMKNNLKFEILGEKILHLKCIQLKKFNKIHYAFYLNIFSDFAYVNSNFEDKSLNNYLSNRLLYSYGIGLDFVTYYDKVIRIEYSINQFFEKGFFLHFKSAI